MINNPPIKPCLKWAGGKRRLLDHVEGYTYYEPFAGSGALFFELQSKKAVINDRNSQLPILPAETAQKKY
ncbi:MAG: DNA adenine methylase [Treponema sp.]|jgi:DNA adenine methylase|nr:DNA adenine methylase [Treponema sp.]